MKPVVRAKPVAPTVEDIQDLNRAVPAQDLGKLPSTAEQYRALKTEMGQEKSAAQTAHDRSVALHAEADELRRQLIDGAARVQALEAEKVELDGDVTALVAHEKTLSASFAKDRVSVARLLAVLELLQHDMPPAMAVRPDDALSAARGAMLVGASLPEVYGAAAELAHRIDALKTTRETLIARKEDAARNAAQLTSARSDLNQLLAIKEIQSRQAESEYGDLSAKLADIAARADNLKTLLDKVSVLRGQPLSEDVVVVSAQSAPSPVRTMMLKPVVGNLVNEQGLGGTGRGVDFDTAPGAQVVAPADGKVLFSGPYHKYGHVLILKTALGYDAVLAGLDHVDVRPGDQVLAGEPVGVMPKTEYPVRLFFELRQNGREIDPTPLLTLELRKARKT